MCPYILKLGPLKFGTYGVMMALGFIFAQWILMSQFKKLGVNKNHASTVILWSALGGILGARLMSIFEEWSEFIANPLGSLLSAGGFSWYGGLIMGTTSVLITCRYLGVPLTAMIEAAGLPLTVGYAFGRGGCQLSGDGCYGVPSDLPWAMTYPHGIVPTKVPVHPAPLYEILEAAVIAVILMKLWGRLPKRGQLFGVYLTLTGLARFFVEFVRRNPKVLMDLSTSQWVAIAMMVGGFGVYLALGQWGPDQGPVAVAVAAGEGEALLEAAAEDDGEGADKGRPEGA